MGSELLKRESVNGIQIRGVIAIDACLEDSWPRCVRRGVVGGHILVRPRRVLHQTLQMRPRRW